MTPSRDYSPGKGEILFLPLGGAGEIGMNLSLYGHDGKWLIVDLGVSFGDDRIPGVEVVVPDISFIAERRDDLAGIVLTHAHEDHLGAVPYLWEKLRVPVYVTPFASGLLRRKLGEDGAPGDVPIIEVPCGGGAEIGPFNIDFIPVAHSIPETHALAITTPVGTVLHVSDWKLDPAPLIGPVTDEAAFRRVGREGVIAMVCDSTNVLVPGHSGSEGDLRDSLIELVGRCSQRVAFACFASNVARLETIAKAAAENDRHVALVGRSLWRINDIARETGYLADVPPFLSESEAAFLPRDKVVLAVTGSQGENRAALARIASDSHPNVVLEEGDTVIFSSRVIPGNEKAIGRLQNQLSRIGVEIITEADHFVHVSGHPARDELAQMYSWVKPPLAVPIHGEQRHLAEHLLFARECQVPQAIMAENGTMLRLHPSPAEVAGHATVGRFAVDGKRMLRLDGDVLVKRRRMGFGGVAVATVVLDEDGQLQSPPQLALPGLVDGEQPDETIRNAAVSAITESIGNLRSAALHRDADVAEAARRAVRRAVWQATGRRPLTEIHVVRT